MMLAATENLLRQERLRRVCDHADTLLLLEPVALADAARLALRNTERYCLYLLLRDYAWYKGVTLPVEANPNALCFDTGQQPCASFVPQNDEFGLSVHECFCGHSKGKHCDKLVSFCLNCHRNHHEDGYQSCQCGGKGFE